MILAHRGHAKVEGIPVWWPNQNRPRLFLHVNRLPALITDGFHVISALNAGVSRTLAKGNTPTMDECVMRRQTPAVGAVGMNAAVVHSLQWTLFHLISDEPKAFRSGRHPRRRRSCLDLEALLCVAPEPLAVAIRLLRIAAAFKFIP